MAVTKDIENKVLALAESQIIEDFNLIKSKCKDERLYAFGIGIVGDITGFFSAGNTIESLKRTLKDEDYHASDFWFISEWEFEGGDDNTLSEYLFSFIDELNEEEYDKFSKTYEHILIQALKNCDEKGIFGTGDDRDELVIYLHYADATDEQIDDISSEQLNSKHIHDLFKNRWDDSKNNLTKVVYEKVKNL